MNANNNGTQFFKELCSTDEIGEMDKISNSTLSPDEKQERLRTQLTALLLRHEHSVKNALSMPMPNQKAKDLITGIIAQIGRLIIGELDLLKVEGMDYKSLIWFFGAPYTIIKRIEADGETETSFADLIVKHHLGNYNHKAIETAITERLKEMDDEESN